MELVMRIILHCQHRQNLAGTFATLTPLSLSSLMCYPRQLRRGLNTLSRDFVLFYSDSFARVARFYRNFKKNS